MKNIVTTGSLVAVAAAGLFACAGSSPDAGPASMASSDVEMVKCAGVNACKGQGACGGQGHDCAGHNECKGQGWVEISAAACTDQGGTII